MPGIVLATINAKWIHPSLALRLLKANLGSLEEHCEILEFALRQPLKEKVEQILAARPRLLALSVSVWNHLATLELLQVLSKEWPEGEPTVVLGGPEVSWLPFEAEIFRHADYVIRGEGEESFRSLCHRVFFGTDSSGFSYSEVNIQERKVVFINQGDATVDLNTIASPYRLYTDEDLGRKLIYVEASRGCPYGCEFCQASIKKQASARMQASGGMQRVREFPLEPFLLDMGLLIDRGGRGFKFLDRTFNLNIARTKKIMEFFLERLEASPVCVHFEMVPFRFPPDLRELLRRFPPGSLRLELGIQTFNPQTASLIHRTGVCGEEIEILEFLRRETNAIVHADLIAGLPGEDILSFGTGFDRLWQALSGASSDRPGTDSSTRLTQLSVQPPFEIQLGILKCLPGTLIARHNQTSGMRYMPEPPYEVMETAALSVGELEKIKNFARFWELIVNRNPFPELLPLLLPAGRPAFDKFMFLSGMLLEKIGKNWGIDRKELRSNLEELQDGV